MPRPQKLGPFDPRKWLVAPIFCPPGMRYALTVAPRHTTSHDVAPDEQERCTVLPDMAFSTGNTRGALDQRRGGATPWSPAPGWAVRRSADEHRSGERPWMVAGKNGGGMPASTSPSRCE